MKKEPEAISIRRYVDDDKAYDALVSEISCELQRNEVRESDIQLQALEVLRGAMSIRDAIKHEKKILEGLGNRQSELQSEKARRPRPVKNDAGDKLDDIITRLALTHSGARPSEVWPHLKTAILEWADTCIEFKTDKADSHSYRFEIAQKKHAISFGVFRKKLHQKKTGF